TAPDRHARLSIFGVADQQLNQVQHENGLKCLGRDAEWCKKCRKIATGVVERPLRTAWTRLADLPAVVQRVVADRNTGGETLPVPDEHSPLCGGRDVPRRPVAVPA